MAAPPGNVLPEGTFELEFKGRRLHGWASDLSDDAQWRIAVHELDRRDGARTENMGRAPAQLRVTLVFVDEEGFADVRALVRSLEEDPSGLLVHPVYGRSRRTCTGFQGARLAAGERNTYVMPVTFVEDNLDASLVSEQAQQPGARAQAVSSQADQVDQLLEPYGPPTEGATLTSMARALSALVVASSGAAPDPSIPSTVDALVGQTALAVAALRAASSAPEVGAAVAACELLLARAVEAGDAALAQRPPVGPWVAPEDVPLVVVAQRFYGADAFARLPELLANNPHVLGLVVVPAGTVLALSPPTTS